ncbi:MAG: GTPase (G3E family) [Lachnospiraceae bacterium]|nr:GTPase (G3E family) [Lachnospiraceae bacterium]
MIKIDLITGFLGSGKTTFIRKYAEFLMKKGWNIGILENDYGAVNVDMMLLQDLEGEQCELEMVAGGCHRDCHRRRFKSKLIAMGMSGYDRVLIEPSGIYDTDEFFDVLHEEPLDQWYEIGNVIAIIDARLETGLSAETEYLLASEVANAGCVVMSKSQEASDQEIEHTIMHLNHALESVRCERRFESGDGGAILVKDWNEFTDSDFERFSACGYVNESFQKMGEEDEGFQSVYFMNIRMSEERLCLAVKQILSDGVCGNVFRVKGFMRKAEEPDGQEADQYFSDLCKNDANGGKTEKDKDTSLLLNGSAWFQLNATRDDITLQPIPVGQEVLIVIGEHLNEEAIRAHLGVE